MSPPFSHEMKDRIIQEQDLKCAICKSDVFPLEVHHSLPEVYGGLSIRENGLGVCHTCHEQLDHYSLDYGITILGPLNEIPDEFFRYGNPFKKYSSEEIKSMNREQLISISKRFHKKNKNL